MAQTMAGPWCILTVLSILSCHSIGMVNCQLIFSQQVFFVEEDIVNSVEICYSYSLDVGFGSASLNAEIFTLSGTATGKLGLIMSVQLLMIIDVRICRWRGFCTFIQK